MATPAEPHRAPDVPPRPGPADGGPSRPRSASRDRRRLGDLLLASGLVDASQLETALADQGADGGRRRRLGRVLVDLGMADERTIAVQLAGQLGLATVDLGDVAVPAETVRRLPRRMCEQAAVCLVELRPDGRAVLAMADPTDVVAVDDARRALGTDVVPVVALESHVAEQLRRAWSLHADDPDLAALAGDLGPDQGEWAEQLPRAGRGVEDSPTVRLVDQILRDAVELRASDVHVETQRDSLRIRYRVDGILRDVLAAPKQLSGSVVSRIKIMSGLDVSERRVPQDGRTRISVAGTAIDTRVSTLPSLHGEKVVVRILARGDAVPALADLGLLPEQLTLVRRALSLPQGLVLITGPTGSGKTSTLYAGLAAVADAEKNIVTLEDPVEVQLPGITQVQVSARAGMTFQAGLRSVLRQDPDVVLVGEVRDGETAELALKAAITGHLVLTTLHTTSAAAALTRLVDMGADPFLVASSLSLSVAQRLVRRPCPGCAGPYRPPDDVLAVLDLTPADLARGTPTAGAGCPGCAGTGYRGRIGVYETLEVDAAMRRVLARDPSEEAVAARAREAGTRTLRASAVLAALAGETTFEEVVRVTTSDRADGHACPACGRPTETAMVACPWCAASLGRSGCRSCGGRLEDGWVVCPWCRQARSPAEPGERAAAGGGSPPPPGDGLRTMAG